MVANNAQEVPTAAARTQETPLHKRPHFNSETHGGHTGPERKFHACPWAEPQSVQPTVDADHQRPGRWLPWMPTVRDRAASWAPDQGEGQVCTWGRIRGVKIQCLGIASKPRGRKSGPFSVILDAPSSQAPLPKLTWCPLAPTICVQASRGKKLRVTGEPGGLQLSEVPEDCGVTMPPSVPWRPVHSAKSDLTPPSHSHPHPHHHGYPQGICSLPASQSRNGFDPTTPC